MPESVRILGIDPGSRFTGYAVIDVFGADVNVVAYGVLKLLPQAIGGSASTPSVPTSSRSSRTDRRRRPSPAVAPRRAQADRPGEDRSGGSEQSARAAPR